jgi:hypothetical protein
LPTAAFGSDHIAVVADFCIERVVVSAGARGRRAGDGVEKN